MALYQANSIDILHNIQQARCSGKPSATSLFWLCKGADLNSQPLEDLGLLQPDRQRQAQNDHDGQFTGGHLQAVHQKTLPEGVGGIDSGQHGAHHNAVDE